MSIPLSTAGRSARRTSVVVAVVLATLLMLVPGTDATAQQTTNADGVVITNVINRDDGTPFQLSTRRSGFQLFAEEDLAGTSLRTTGNYRMVFINAGGLCPFAGTGGDLFNTNCASNAYFHVTPVWGVGLEEYRKIRDVHPGVAGMLAPVGYSTPWRITSLAPRAIRIGPADGQFGRLFSGVTTNNAAGGCTAFSAPNTFPDNFTMSAVSDCPETWAPGGWQGYRQVSDAAWLAKFQANPAAFTWDSFKMTAEPDAPVVGSLSTYGNFSDFPREILAIYGGVTPKGSGLPRDRGFPLGLEVRVDAFKFDRPSVRDGAYIRWLVINRSEQVWGRGIDYDKIYMGVDPGYTLSGQRPNAHNWVEKGTHIASGGNLSGLCSNTFPRRVLPGANQGCDGAGTTPRVIMILKSPLGDLKNKLFSDPTSPYFFPSHPDADDTITYNHWRKGDFGAVEQWVWRFNDRSMYGYMSGDVESFLAGRPRDFMSATQIFNYFLWDVTD